MSNKSKRGEALVWESFCEAATSVATSIDCCKTSVQVTHGMVRDRSIILLEVLVPGPRDKHEIDVYIKLANICIFIFGDLIQSYQHSLSFIVLFLKTVFNLKLRTCVRRDQ